MNFKELFEQLPEPELWRLLQDVIASEVELDDSAIQRLDDRMQGFLFLQERIGNREARIEFARSANHMTYLRDAAGSRNVWMDDEEFTELVTLDDPVTLACFGRCEQMKPHHLAYIEYKLAAHPHRNELLATSYDTSITLKKALELQGNTREMELLRLARTALEGKHGAAGPIAEEPQATRRPRLGKSSEASGTRGVGRLFYAVEHSRLPPQAGAGKRDPSLALDPVARSHEDPRTLWRVYLGLKGLDEPTLRELLAMAGLSTGRPRRTSGAGVESIH